MQFGHTWGTRGVEDPPGEQYFDLAKTKKVTPVRAGVTSMLAKAGMSLILENDTGADTSVMVGKTAHSDRIPVDLDSPDLEIIADLDIESAAQSSRKSRI
jgi:hypothetical protein